MPTVITPGIRLLLRMVSMDIKLISILNNFLCFADFVQIYVQIYMYNDPFCLVCVLQVELKS